MKVTLLHYTLSPVVGGVEMVINYHVQELLANGHTVTVLAGRGGDDIRLAGAQVIVRPELDSRDSDNMQIALSLEQGVVPPKLQTLQSRIEDFLLPLCAYSDVVIAHNVFNFHFNLPLVAALHHLIDQGQLPHLIAWCHDISRYVNSASGAELRFGFLWDLLRTYRPEVTYVAVSLQRQRALSAVLGCTPRHIHVISNGVDAPTLLGLSELTRHFVEEFDLLGADLIILMPIRITRAKNIEFALQMIASLRNAGLRPRLVVTGPPDPHAPDSQSYWRDLAAMRENLDLVHEVVFLYEGTSQLVAPLTIDLSHVAELYRLCDIVLITSLREGFGLPVLEGGLIGKPIFCTAMPALDNIDARSVHLIGTDESPQQVATQILAWVQADLAYQLRRQVRQSYTWSTLFRNAIQPLITRVARASEQKS